MAGRRLAWKIARPDVRHVRISVSPARRAPQGLRFGDGARRSSEAPVPAQPGDALELFLELGRIVQFLLPHVGLDQGVGERTLAPLGRWQVHTAGHQDGRSTRCQPPPRGQQLPQADRDFAWLAVLVEQSAEQRLPEVSALDLRQAWLSILSRAKHNRHHKVKQDELSVREQMSWIVRYLDGRDYVAFEELFDIGKGVAHLVVNFIAVLELVKEGMVRVSQDEPYQPIYVRLAVV